MARSLRDEQAWLMTGSLVMLALVAAGFLLNYTRPVLLPFVLAIFISSIIAPLVDIQVLKLRVPRAIAVVLTLLVTACVFFVFGLLVVQTTFNLVKSAETYSQDIAQAGRDLLGRLEEHNVTLSADDAIRQVQSTIVGWTTWLAGSLLSLVSRVVLVAIFVGFLLAGRNPKQVRRGVYADIDTQIRRYLGTKMFISAITGTLVWLILRTIGLQLAGVFGLAAFALNFVPNVGSIISTLLPIPTALAQFPHDMTTLIAVVAVPGLTQMAIGNVIEPKLLGEGLKLHPITILLSLAIWGLVWGPMGMLLAVPMTATLRIVLDQFAISRPTGRLLAGELPEIRTSARIS